MKNNDKTLFKLLASLLLGCASLSAVAQPCSGVPVIGSTSATSVFFTCSGTPELTLSSYPSETGITYQWQISPQGQNNFTNVGGVLTTPELTAEQINTSMDYRVIATCTNVMASDTSDTLTILVDNSPSVITSDPANVSMICPGAATMLTGTATGAGGGPTYQWLMNGNTVLVDGGIYSGTGTNTLMISDAGDLNNNTYQMIALGCTIDTSVAATITVNAANTWTGAVSNLWSDAGNWGSCGVPTIASDVTIAATLNQPVIDSAWANTLTIDAGASVTFASDMPGLHVRSTITNNGTFDATNGSVEFVGGVPQNIPAGTYANLIISGGGEKQLDGNVTVTDTLMLDIGFIILGDDTLTLAAPELTAGGSGNAFIVTDGDGVVKGLNIDAADSVTFHVGPTALIYNPLGFSNEGTTDNFSVRVMENVYLDGIGLNILEVLFPVVDRTWMITEDVQGGSDVTISPFWNINEGINGFDPSWVYLIRHNGLLWQSLIDSATVGSIAIGTGPYYITATDVSVLGTFSIGSGNQFPLTIKLTDISAVNVGASNKIEWTSSDEAMGDKYELQHSVNGKAFTAIANINAKGTGSSYTYYDKNAVKGINYYRLKMTDFAGHEEYSKVVSAAMGETGAATVHVYPNPASTNVTVAVNQLMGNASASVTDVTGKVVSSVAIKSNATNIDMSSLAPGVYFIKYKDDATSETIRVIKK